MTAPAITAVIINYNQGRYFEDCYISTIHQTFRDFELIIIDDCSTDDSVNEIRGVLERFPSEHQFLINERNQGICANLNMALKLARGKYFTFIASDDWGESDRFEKLYHAVQTGEGNAVAYSDCKLVDEDKQPLHPSYIRHFRPDLKKAPEGDVFTELINGNFIPAMCTLIETRFLRDLGGFDEKLKFEDYDIWLRLARKNHFVFVPGAEGYYRIVQSSLIRRLGARKFEDLIVMYMKHLDTVGETLQVVKGRVRATCGALYYTDSSRFGEFYHLLKRQNNTSLKLRVLYILSRLGVRGSRFKKL